MRLLIRNNADVNHFVSSCDTNLIMQVQCRACIGQPSTPKFKISQNLKPQISFVPTGCVDTPFLTV